MDLLERLNQKFGNWYENIFGSTGSADLRPKDVLRKILHAMDDNRSEGIDGKVYVPNKYILVLNLPDNDEREYMLAFLDEAELSDVLQRYMAQNGYSVRGPLRFSFTDALSENIHQTAKLTVKAKFEKQESSSLPATDEPPAINASVSVSVDVTNVDADDLTVSTVPSAWATLIVTEDSGAERQAALSNASFFIGRSQTAGNDLVLSDDRKVSKQHARIHRAGEGVVQLQDLNSTNGVLLNGRPISGVAPLQAGDRITIGDTVLLFDLLVAYEAVSAAAPPTRRRSLLVSLAGGDDHILASDNLIGSAITNDIVLDDEQAAARQARVSLQETGCFTIEDLSGNHDTLLNGRTIYSGERIKLNSGDRISFGPAAFQYLEKEY